jgi:MOSC domain-containing protein YiiM
MTAKLVAAFISPEAEAPMQSVGEVHLEASRGIVGDRYYLGTGTFSEKLRGKPDSEVTLIESEQIDHFNNLSGLNLGYGEPRRNLVTVGVGLNELVGVRFSVGAVVLEGIRLCEPCAHLASVVADQVLPTLVHRAGLRAKIIKGGVIRPSDRIDDSGGKTNG